MGCQLLAVDGMSLTLGIVHQELWCGFGRFHISGSPGHECCQTGIFFTNAQKVLQLALCLSHPNLAPVIHATPTSRLDCYNSFNVRLPLRLTLKLQLIQNAGQWVLAETPHREHIQTVLHELCWVPMEYQVRFKDSVLSFKALKGLEPLCLRNFYS